MELLERDGALDVLKERLRAVMQGPGHVAVIAGEAGIGKTSVLKAVAAHCIDTDVWWGHCDALQTPHPLAPLHDIVRSTGVSVGSLLNEGAGRDVIFEAVLAELQQRRRPVFMVIEDAHWADEATLDLLKFLGRRIEGTRCLLVISYRDDEVGPAHPLRSVIGDLPSAVLTRVDLHRLSADAVGILARRALRSPGGVYKATRGNPFFVTEVLRHGSDGLPRSVQDLVLARFARLSHGAQAVLRLASVIPGEDSATARGAVVRKRHGVRRGMLEFGTPDIGRVGARVPPRACARRDRELALGPSHANAARDRTECTRTRQRIGRRAGSPGASRRTRRRRCCRRAVCTASSVRSPGARRAPRGRRPLSRCPGVCRRHGRCGKRCMARSVRRRVADHRTAR